MKKKFLSLMLAIAMISGILPTISFAAKLDGEITFVDATEYNTVTDFEEDDEICAKLAGTAEGSGSADVYAASYNKGELLSCQWLAGQSVMDGMQLDVTTNTIEIAEGADEVRVFVWDLKNNMKPLLESGVIYKKKATGGSSADVDNTNGVVGTEVNLAGENVSANVPAGVQLENGADELTLSLQSLNSSASGVEAGEGQALASFDVHIHGVSEENNVPIIVTVDNFTKEGYNKGNLELYHVEKDGTKPMNEVSSPDELDEHNTYYYNPETGSLTLALASFSEIAVVADTDKGWKGEFDYSWYNADETELKISNADQLAAFGAIVGGMNGKTRDSFSGKTVKLTADINLADAEDKEKNNSVDKIFHPIGYYFTAEDAGDGKLINAYSTVQSFEGTFDGNGHKISNFYHNTWEIKGDYNSGYPANSNYYNDAMGLFGYVVNGTVKNLTVDSFSSDGEFTPTGVIAAYAVNSTFANIAITNCNPRVYNTGNGGIVGIGGNSDDPDTYKLTFTNITIDNSNKITALWGSWDVACGGLVGMFRGAGHVYMTNCHVAAQIDVYNDVCGNYQYYWYRYSGMMVGTNKNMITDKDGYTVPETSKFHAEGCTVHFGDWNDYYYCELVANSLASYTHDHQFSRLTQISRLDEIKSGDTWTKTGNFLLISGETKTCYHIVKNTDGTLKQHLHTDSGEETVDVNGDGVKETVLKENNQIIYLPFNQLFTGYGWGVKHIPVYNGKDYAFEGITILDRKVADSVVKFETKFTGDFLYRVGNQNTVSLNSLFKAKDGATINNSGVYVSIDKVDENIDVSGVFTAAEEGKAWTEGTIQFTGTGVVKVTIQDYDYCKPTVLYLEVVDAVNATEVTDATANNVVLLNDIGNGFTVSGEYAFYGNGFTLNYTGNGQYLNNGLRQGLVTVSEDGILDNLRIKASIYPRAYLYYGSTPLGDYVQGGPSSVEGDKTRYHYQLSSIVAKGNATISNCYVYGGRTNIFVDTGDVTIKDSVLECGTVANVQVQSTNEYTVTLEDVTTIQHQVNSTIDDTTKVMLGAGVLVGPDTTTNPKIVLNGEFKQYNWVTAEDAEKVSDTRITKAIINGAVNATAYNHTVNDKTASNLGIIYMNENTASVDNKTGLPYVLGEITMTLGGNEAKGKVCSLQNATADQIYSDYENADRTTEQGDYFVASCFNFDLGNQEISYDGEGDERYLYGDKKGVTALYKDGEGPLTLDISKLVTVSKYTGINYVVSAECINESGNKLTATNNVVTLEAKGAYTLVFTVNDNLFYDATGKAVDKKSVTREFRVPLTLDVKAADIKDAEVNITKTALDGVYTTVNLTDYKLRVNFLDCISVTDYDNKGTGTTVNLSSNISSATLTPSGVNVFTTASTVTVTYTDGRVLTVNLSKISGSSPGTKTAIVNTSGGLYFITEGALDNKPTAASSQNKCTITSVSYKGNNGSTVTNDTDVTVTWALGSSSGCVTPDTLITLSNGSQKRIDEVTYDDELLAWDFNSGRYAVTTPSLIESHENQECKVINLNFEDGTTVRIIVDHGFFDVSENNFVFINEENVGSYVGHDFVKATENGEYNTTKLVDYSITVENVGYYTIQTAIYNNCIAENMFTLTSPPVGVDGWFDYFEIGDDMKYDKAKKQADIEKYGLYDYEDFSEYVTYEQFIAFNGPYLKVLVGRGVLTYEKIIELISTYVKTIK